KPLDSWNVVWANTHHWIELARMSAAAKGWRKIAIWFLPPEELAGAPRDVNAATLKKYDVRGTRPGQIYGMFLFLTALAGLFVLTENLNTWSTVTQIVVGVLVIWTLACTGGFIERRAWAKWAEAGRLLCFAALLIRSVR